MFVENLLKRKQLRWYDTENIPDVSIIKSSVQETYETVASKQNLIPYKLYVIENNPELNQGLYDLSKGGDGTVVANVNLLTAPYQFIYTARLVTDQNEKVQKDLAKGHIQPPCHPVEYKWPVSTEGVCIEIGMHATVLSEILIQRGLGVSYTRCFQYYDVNVDLWNEKGFSFIEDTIYLLMSAGYPDPKREYKPETYTKPPIENVVRYI